MTSADGRDAKIPPVGRAAPLGGETMTDRLKKTARIASMAVALTGATLVVGHVVAGMIVVHVVASLLHSVIGLIATTG
jgi:hypothetical protein